MDCDKLDHPHLQGQAQDEIQRALTRRKGVDQSRKNAAISRLQSNNRQTQDALNAATREFNATEVSFLIRMNVLMGFLWVFRQRNTASPRIRKSTDAAHRRIFLSGLLAAGCWLMALMAALAQQAGQVDPSFVASLGLANGISQAVVQPDGKLLVVGGFRGLARLNADGSVDTSFQIDQSLQNFVDFIVLQPDGKILVTSNYTQPDGTFVLHARITRLNADGSVDPAFSGVNAEYLIQFIAPALAVGGKNPRPRAVLPVDAEKTDFGKAIASLTLQTDGKLLIAGGFTSVNGTPGKSVARLDVDGSLDRSFQPDLGFDGSVAKVFVQPDGKLLLLGFFTDATRLVFTDLRRLNADGSVDSSFNFVGPPDRSVNSIALQPDGKVLINSTLPPFSSVLSRLNADGSADPTFTSPTLFYGVNGTINAFVLQPDGKIFINELASPPPGGGNPTSVLSRVNADGTPDASFDSGSGPNAPITVLALQPDGKVLAGGTFTSFNGTPGAGLARLNADGSVDPAFSPAVVPGPNEQVQGVVLQPNGKVLISGAFTSVNNVPYLGFARLNADGGLDENLQPGSTPDGGFIPLAVQPDGKILVQGPFRPGIGFPSVPLARLNPDGSPDAGFQPEPGIVNVSGIDFQPDGKMLVRGVFSLTTKNGRRGLVRLNADGSLDSSFAIFQTLTGNLSALVLLPDGRILVGGSKLLFDGATQPASIVLLNADGTLNRNFDFVPLGDFITLDRLLLQPDGKVIVIYTETGPSLTGSHLVRLNANGSVDAGFDNGAGINGSIVSTALQPDGKLLILVRSFAFFNSAPAYTLSRINADGSVNKSFTPAPVENGQILSFSLQPNGKVLIGGSFNMVNGVARNYVARLNADGGLDAGFAPGEGGNAPAVALVEANGTVLIGGRLKSGVQRLNPDGSTDASFNAGGTGANGEVMALAKQADGGTLVGGAFTSFNGAAATRLTRLLPDGSLDARFAPIINAIVAALAVQADSKIIIGGDFTQVYGQPRSGLARLNADGSLDQSFVADVQGGDDTSANASASGAPAARPTRRAASTGGAAKVRALAIVPGTAGQPDKLLVGGKFSRIAGAVRAQLAQLILANGTAAVDNSFDPGPGPDEMVRALAQQPDGRVLAGGSFVMVSGVRRPGLVRLEANGSVDKSFNAGLQSADDKALDLVSVRSLVLAAVKSGGAFGSLQPSGDHPVRKETSIGELRLVFGGSFAKVGDAVRQGIARLELDKGRVDAAFNPGAGTDGPVMTVAMQTDGRTIIGGKFNTVDQQPRVGVARLLGDKDAIVDPNLPTVSLEFISDAHQGGKAGRLRLRRAGDASAALVVHLAYGGTAKNGVDYAPRPETVKLPAGNASKIIKIAPIDNPASAGEKMAAVRIVPDPAYRISADAPLKVKVRIAP